ncbi:MAG: efflux RND transporter periplasmic adaptor subunit [Thalassotalea sp.]
MLVNTKIILATAVGIIIGAAAINFLSPMQTSTAEKSESVAEKQPLYWVAPMDDNYRKSKPGKSPMGMELVPVYQDASDGQAAGAVKISPAVINNLGVRTAPVIFKPMINNIKTVGYVQYDEANIVHIHPRVEGWVDTLYVKAVGNQVQKGEPLYTLYSPQLVNAQEEFLISLNRNNKVLIKAAKARLLALQLPADFIQELQQSKTVKQSITFYAPQSGVVDGLQIREGFFVKPGNTIMSIGKLSQVWVEAEVFERDAALVKAGLPVVMTLDYLPARTWHGVIDYVYPTLNAQTRTLRARLKFNNADLLLKPNMFASVMINTQADGEMAASVIQVPKESVIRTGKQDRVVLALGDGQFKSIAVTIGRVGDDVIEILAGLTADDVVVTSAQFLLDSESSKSSDFMRMTALEQHQGHQPMLNSNANKMTEKMTEQYATASVTGVINHIDLENRLLNISRSAIEKWQRPPATMDFSVAPMLDLTALTLGMSVTFTFEVRDDLVIVAIAPKTATAMPEMKMPMSSHDHAKMLMKKEG